MKTTRKSRHTPRFLRVITRLLATLGFAAVASVSSSASIDVVKQLVISPESFVVPRVLAASKDGGVWVLGEQTSGGESALWIAKIDAGLALQWQKRVAPGVPLPGAHRPEAAFEAPDGTLALFAQRPGFKSQPVTSMIKMSRDGEVISSRPLDCVAVANCSVMHFVAGVAQENGIVSFRSAVVPSGSNAARREIIRFIHKASWDGKTLWQRPAGPINGVARGIERIPNGFAVAEYASVNVTITTFDDAGEKQQVVSQKGVGRQASLFRLDDGYAVFGWTDDNARDPAAKLGGRLRELDGQFNQIREVQTSDMSGVMLISNTSAGLFLAGFSRPGVGAYSKAAIAVLDAAGKTKTGLKLDQQGASSQVLGALRRGTKNQFVLLQQSYVGWIERSANARVVVSLIEVSP